MRKKSPYNVVAFMVTVKVVEKRVKSNVGMENVASLITKYSTEEMR